MFPAKDAAGAAPSFHPGLTTAIQKRGVKLRKGHGLQALPPWKCWYLLPFSASQQDFRVHFTLSRLQGFTIFSATDTSGGSPWLPLLPNQVDQCNRLVEANARLRGLARRFSKRWIYRKKIQHMNVEDLVTLEVPHQPIEVYDWPARKVFVYEASTLARDMRECLLQRDYMFPSPIQPRNLLTNAPLTPMQCLSVLQQLRATRKRLHWSIAAFEEERYELENFRVRYEQPLRLEVLKTLFAQPTNDDTVYIVLDFISTEHTYHERTFLKRVYEWALKNAGTTPRIKGWRELTFQYHQITIEGTEQPEKIAKIEVITNKSLDLCTHPTELIELWTKQKKAAAAAAAVARPIQ